MRVSPENEPVENTEPTSPGPTDARIVAVLRGASGALDTAEIGRLLGLHPNGVRVHLRRLAARGLVERRPVHGSRGRPRDTWIVTPRAIAEAERPHTGWSIARSLARAIPASGARLAEVERAGAELGEELAAEVPHAEVLPDGLDQALEAMGFQPVRDGGDGEETVRYRLMTCPYAEAVRENPAVVCTLHRGIIRGALERLSPDWRLTRFEARDPDLAGCLVEIRRSP